MTKNELVEAASEMTGGNIKDLTLEHLQKLMTVTQFVTDLCLNEIERRGELTFLGDMPIVPTGVITAYKPFSPVRVGNPARSEAPILAAATNKARAIGLIQRSTITI